MRSSRPAWPKTQTSGTPTTIELADAARDAITVPIQRPAPAPAPVVEPTRPAAVPAPRDDQRSPLPPLSATAKAADYQALDAEAETVETTEPKRVGQPTRRRRQLRSLSAISKVAMIILILCFAGASGYMVWHHRETTERAQRAAMFTAGAKQGVVNMFSIDFSRAKEDVQRVIDSSTGQFRDDFSQRASDFVKTVEQSKTVTQGTVKAAAVESMDAHSAVVLVSASSRISNSSGANDEPRAWRLRVTVTEESGQYKMSKVDFIT